MKELNKRGISLQQLAPMFILFLVTAIVLSIGSDIVDTVRQDNCPVGCAWNNTAYACSNSTNASTPCLGYGYVYNVSLEGLEGTGEIGGWFGTIGLVMGASAVIGIVYMLMGRN